jgi:hypothetical protein
VSVQTYYHLFARQPQKSAMPDMKRHQAADSAFHHSAVQRDRRCAPVGESPKSGCKKLGRLNRAGRTANDITR